MKWRLTELNKGQEISDENFGVFNFFKRTTKKIPQFCPSMLKAVESKNKGTFDFIVTSDALNFKVNTVVIQYCGYFEI